MKTCDEQPIFEIEIQIYFYIKAIFGVSLLSWRMQLIEKKSPKKHVAMSLNCICLFNCKTFIKFDRFQWNGWVQFRIVFFGFFIFLSKWFPRIRRRKKRIFCSISMNFWQFWLEMNSKQQNHVIRRAISQLQIFYYGKILYNLLLSSSK